MKKDKSLVKSDAFPGILLVVATILALIIANTGLSKIYEDVLLNFKVIGELNIHEIINDFFMAIFFLVVGLEIKREFIYGNLSNFKDALFPILAAVGGMIFPALIYFFINVNGGYIKGMGVPISTDIAFAIGIFSLLKSRMNEKLKIFLLTLAVVDDLLSIIVIGIFYSSHINFIALLIAVVISVLLFILQKSKLKDKLYLYLILGFALLITVFYSGIHSTISGVILALMIPVLDHNRKEEDLNEKLKETLEPVVNYIILPLFAFSNTGINLQIDFDFTHTYPLFMGIILGLVLGKPLGIMIFSYVGEKLKILKRPQGVKWMEVLAVSMLAGIGYTMAIFVAEIAFAKMELELEIAKISILIALIISIVLTYLITFIKEKKVQK